MYILGFSGPPHCGKDTIATQIESLLQEEVDVTNMHLAEPMREMGMNLLGLAPNLDDTYAYAKANPQPLFQRDRYNLSPDNLRQFMIWMSEDCIKPRYGKDFWARKLSFDYGEWDDGLLLVPDFGFKEEVEFFEREIGAENVGTIHLHREDCDFSNDSRSYVGGTRNVYTIANNSTPQYCAERIIWVLRDSFGWTL